MQPHIRRPQPQGKKRARVGQAVGCWSVSTRSCRGHLHLLLAALVNTGAQIGDKEGPASRQRLLCHTISLVVQASERVYAADGLLSPQLPPLDDAQFRVGHLHMSTSPCSSVS